MLSEITQSQKEKYSKISLIYEVAKIVKLIDVEQNSGCQGMGEREMRSCYLMDIRFQL